MKRKDCFIVLFFSIIGVAGFAQVPQMQLKPQQFTPVPYTPTPYTPVESNNSTLARSLQKRERNANNASAGLQDLMERCQEIRNLLAPSDLEWFKDYHDSICRAVNIEIEAGNYQSAASLASRYKSNTYSDKNVQYRIDSYKKYCDEMRGRSVPYTQGKVNEPTYQYWLYKNQYKFQPIYDEQGNLTGFKPQFITYLYPGIDWEEAYTRVTVNGKTQDKIKEMWRAYFSFGGDRSGSLRQEFDVAVFYLEYYTHCLENDELDQDQKAQLEGLIGQLKSLVQDANGEISFDIYVRNLQDKMRTAK